MDHVRAADVPVLVEEYTRSLQGKGPATIDVYLRILRQITGGSLSGRGVVAPFSRSSSPTGISSRRASQAKGSKQR